MKETAPTSLPPCPSQTSSPDPPFVAEDWFPEEAPREGRPPNRRKPRLQLIPQSHTMAFYYTTGAESERMCIGRGCVGGIEATEDIKLCLASPVALGWNKNAGGAFKSNVGDLMGLNVADIQVLIVLQVRTTLEHSCDDCLSTHAWQFCRCRLKHFQTCRTRIMLLS